jgi:hypothetical protein
MTHYVWKLFIIHITSILLPCLTLPRNIRIAAILDREGDEKHELAFTAAIDDINNRNNWILDGIEIEPEVIKIPYGDRYVSLLILGCYLTSKRYLLYNNNYISFKITLNYIQFCC